MKSKIYPRKTKIPTIYLYRYLFNFISSSLNRNWRVSSDQSSGDGFILLERKEIHSDQENVCSLGTGKKKRLKTFSLYFHLLQLNDHNLKKLKKIQINLIWNHLYLKSILQALEQTREGGFNSKPSLYWKLCPLNLYFMYFVQYFHQYSCFPLT